MLATLKRLLEILVVACIAIMAIVVCIGIFYRYYLDNPLSWTGEISRFALIWMTFLGGALITGEREGHVAVELFIDSLGPRSKRIATAVSTVLEVSIVLLITVGGVLLIRGTLGTTSPATGIPMGYVYSVIPLFGMLCLVFIGIRVANNS